MSQKFQVPAKPWGDKEVKMLMAHQDILSDDVRAELGLKPLGNKAPEAAAQTQQQAPQAPQNTPIQTPAQQAPKDGEQKTDAEKENATVNNTGAQQQK